jgi:nucleotide-binding universal stress UspA family protein
MAGLQIRHILTPSDMSEEAASALGWAGVYADQLQAKLTVLYSDPLVYPIDFAGPTEAFFVTPSPEQESQLREQLEKHVSAVIGDRAHEVIVTTGQPVPTILRAVEELGIDLVVMGTHARHGWRRAILGSVSEGVLHGSERPVVTVRGRELRREPGAVAQIVCPVNFTDVARASLQLATGLAEAFGASLHVVYVVEPNDTSGEGDDDERIRSWIAAAVPGAGTLQELVLRGGAAERVLDYAEDINADLLVIGAQHRLFRDDTVVGTTTERLIRFSGCPVLVVPTRSKEVQDRLRDG